MSRDPWVTFRIHVNRRGSGRRGKPFYRVFIFDHVRTMRAFLAEQDRTNPEIRCRGGWGRAMAAARYFGPHAISRSPNQCGVVVFHAGTMGGGVVSHEMAHAALYATHPGKSFPFTFPKRYDETLAWTIGDMVAQFWRAYWKRERAIKALRGKGGER